MFQRSGRRLVVSHFSSPGALAASRRGAGGSNHSLTRVSSLRDPNEVACHGWVVGQVNWVVVQGPDRGPAAAAVTDAPTGHPFGKGALTASDQLGRDTEEAQCFVGALHLPQ